MAIGRCQRAVDGSRQTIDSITHIFFTSRVCKQVLIDDRRQKQLLNIAWVDGTNLPASMHLTVNRYQWLQMKVLGARDRESYRRKEGSVDLCLRFNAVTAF